MSDVSPPNFLTCPIEPQPSVQRPSEPVRAPAKTGRSWRRWLCISVLFLTAALFLSPLIYGGAEMALAGRELKQTAAQINLALRQQDFRQAQQALPKIQAEILALHQGIEDTRYWRQFPWIGSRLRFVRQTDEALGSAAIGWQRFLQVMVSLQDAVQASQQAQATFQVGIDHQRSFNQLSAEDKRLLLARLSQSLPEIRIAHEQLSIALKTWQDNVDLHVIPAALRPQLERSLQQINAINRSLDQGLALLEVFLPFSGYPKPRTYLILLQNADEQRPTGGFMGTVGVLKVDGGNIQQLEFRDVYAIDGRVAKTWNDQPPDVLRRQLGLSAWFLRDSNWSPDFPDSARKIIDVYTREQTMAGIATTTLDGVIAVEPDVFKSLLTMVGDLSVDGAVFTPDNFFQRLQYQAEVGFRDQGKPISARKDLVIHVGQALWEQLKELPVSRWPELLNVFVYALDHKDILAYSQDVQTQNLLQEHGWDGHIVPAIGQDYVWAVDANLAAFKTDGVMDKQLRYQLDARDPAGPLATATLTYAHQGQGVNWQYTRYRDYLRLYVPDGSQLLAVDGATGPVDVFHELGKTVFGTFWSIEPGSSRSLRFRYRLPLTANVHPLGPDYHLLIQKQPGNRLRLTLDLLFGKNVTAAVPAELPSEFGDAHYRVTVPLDRDRSFDVKLAQ